MTTGNHHTADLAPHYIDAVEGGQALREGAYGVILGKSIKLSIEGLKDFFFADWRPELIDLLIIAAAVEYCDLSIRRPTHGWARSFNLRIAVHDHKVWNAEPVVGALEETLAFLTGDCWQLTFIKRLEPVTKIKPRILAFDTPDRVILPYSDGLDSRAVAALIEDVEKDGLVRVRLGTKGADTTNTPKAKRRFTAVPFEVKLGKRQRVESSARSRGFKFAVITGIAAQLAAVERVVVTESGQGSIGPTLASTGQSFPDYRVHPAFTRRVEKLFETLTGKAVNYEYPRIWHTKGETLAEAHALRNPPDWNNTRSCWQSARQVSFEGRRRQCGICAACMLRRMSIHHAGIEEAQSEYIWENLSATDISEGHVSGFSHMNTAFEEYAIAGALHLDHLASLAHSELHRRAVRRAARETADAMGVDRIVAERNLVDLFERHRAEWLAFLTSLGPQSFIARIAIVSPWQ